MTNQKNIKGIVLAGGSGTRLFPLTIAISKHMLPVYDKPMIYYPLSTLMMAGIKDILIITTPSDIKLYSNLLGNGDKWGINLTYAIQPDPGGLAQAFIIGEDFIGDDLCSLILGDNIFYGHNFSSHLKSAVNSIKSGQYKSKIFTCMVNNPQRYGVLQTDKELNPSKIIEKPESFISKYAVTGLYFYDNSAVHYAKSLNPSNRGELEITDLNNIYLNSGDLGVEFLGRGMAWFDAGTHDSLIEVNQFIQTIERRQGIKIACLEEIAFRNSWISSKKIEEYANSLSKTKYGQYLQDILEE